MKGTGLRDERAPDAGGAGAIRGFLGTKTRVGPCLCRYAQGYPHQ